MHAASLYIGLILDNIYFVKNRGGLFPKSRYVIQWEDMGNRQMRERLGRGFRKVGESINNFDKAYAGKFERDAKGPIDGIGLMGRAVPLSESYQTIGMSEYEARGGIGPRTRNERDMGRAAGTGVFAANLASRYLLPAGGVTLAGKGLYDLTVAFGSSADQPQPGELGLQ